MDLHAPLGKTPPSPRRRWPAIAAAALAATGLVVLGVYLLQADPHGGEPYAVAVIPPAPPPVPPKPARAADPTPASPDPMPTGSIAPSQGSDTSTIENGVRVVTPSGAGGARRPGPLVIDVSKALDGAGRRARSVADNAPAALPTVTAGVPPGQGAQPHAGARPRIAIFVGALGLNEAATRAAIETMPAAVDLAFVPYGATLAESVATARSRGHEVLLQLPMASGPAGALGPHALTADESASAMQDDLSWLTSRFSGYVGITNLLGSALTSKSQAMTKVLRFVDQRGVFYVDDGTSRDSQAAALGSWLGVRVVQANVVLDATGDPSAVRANCDRLVAIAKAKGVALGTASALSDHMAAIARFAGELDARGIALVPVSELAHGDPSAATAR